MSVVHSRHDSAWLSKVQWQTRNSGGSTWLSTWPDSGFSSLDSQAQCPGSKSSHAPANGIVSDSGKSAHDHTIVQYHQL